MQHFPCSIFHAAFSMHSIFHAQHFPCTAFSVQHFSHSILHGVFSMQHHIIILEDFCSATNPSHLPSIASIFRRYSLMLAENYAVKLSFCCFWCVKQSIHQYCHFMHISCNSSLGNALHLIPCIEPPFHLSLGYFLWCLMKLTMPLK